MLPAEAGTGTGTGDEIAEQELETVSGGGTWRDVGEFLVDLVSNCY